MCAFPAPRNSDVMARAVATVLDHEDKEGSPLCDKKP